jgi:hypothetical protein
LWRGGDGLFLELLPFASDALLTTLHPLLANVLQTVDHQEISYFGSPSSWLKKPRNFMGRDLDCMANVLLRFHRSTFSKPNTEFNSGLAQCDFWAFLTLERSSEPRNFEVVNSLQHVFEEWVERCKKYIACKGKHFEKETVTAPPYSSDLE